jgi:hypothetical protein
LLATNITALSLRQVAVLHACKHHHDPSTSSSTPQNYNTNYSPSDNNFNPADPYGRIRFRREMELFRLKSGWEASVKAQRVWAELVDGEKGYEVNIDEADTGTDGEDWGEIGSIG